MNEKKENSIRTESGKEKLFRLFKHPEVGVLLAFIVVFLFFTLTSDRFLTMSNIRTTLLVSTELGIMAIGVTFLMIAGEFDLSVGSIFGFSILICTLLANTGLNSIVALIITLLAAAIIGAINGIITLKAYIPSFITTLGMSLFIRGIMLSVSTGFTISYSGDSYIISLLGSTLGSSFGIFRSSVIIFVVMIIIFTVILKLTRFGVWVFATGGNNEVARSVGVNVTKVKLICFTLAGLMAGVSGLVSLARFKISDVLLGTGMELEAIAATVIGGTLLTGGRGSIIGAFLGVLTMGMVRSGLILLGVPAFWYRSFVGIILVVVAVINSSIVRRIK